MGQINYILSLMFIGIFTAALIGFGIGFASDNDSAVDISDDPEITNLKTLNEGNLSSSEDSITESYTSIVKSSVEQGETIESGGVFSLTITNIIPTIINVIDVGFSKIFGSENNFSVFFTAFLSIMAFLGFMYFVKTWLGRNPD